MEAIKLHNGKINVLKADTVLSVNRLRVVMLTEQHEKFDGTTSPEFTWSLAQSKSGAAVMIYCPNTEEIALVEQFRAATILPPFVDNDTVFEGHGRLLEIVAGGLDEDDPESCALREADEEAGVKLSGLLKIGEFFLSPGVTNEKIHLYFGTVDSTEEIGKGGGLSHENEDTHIHLVKLEDAYRMIETGEIQDAKSIIGIYKLVILDLKGKYNELLKSLEKRE